MNRVISSTAGPISHLNKFFDLQNGQKNKIYMRFSDAAIKTGASIKTIERWVLKYEVPWFYVGNTRRLHWESLKKALEREAERAI